MIRIIGVVLLLVSLYAALFISDVNAFSLGNLITVANRQGFFAVLTIAVAVVIITGGIDLSIGSVIGLTAVLFGVLMQNGYQPLFAFFICIGVGFLIGLVNGVLVTFLQLQPFLVTLCGLFIFRGVARTLTSSPVGIQKVIQAHQAQQENPERPDFFIQSLRTMRRLLVGKDLDGELSNPMLVVIAAVLVVILAVVLHRSAHGRYLYAIGYNDKAARYAGIGVDWYRLAVYMVCSMLTAFAGVLFFLDYGTATPSTTGESLELYAITGAVLGGCSLRGGDGTALGVILGAAVLPLLKNLMNFVGISDDIMPIIIGLTLFVGVIVDELFRRPGLLNRVVMLYLWIRNPLLMWFVTRKPRN